MRNLIYIFLVIVIFFGCNNTSQLKKINIEGVWVGEVNGNNYLEIVIFPKNIFTKTGDSGNFIIVSKWLFYYSHQDLLSDALSTYLIRNDSLFNFKNDLPELHLNILKMNENELIFNHDSTYFQLTKLPDGEGFQDLSNIDTLKWDNIFFKQYLEKYYDRRKKFEDAKNNN